MGQLVNDAIVIKLETAKKANTALRVGGWMEDAGEQIELNQSNISTQLSKITALEQRPFLSITDNESIGVPVVTTAAEGQYIKLGMTPVSSSVFGIGYEPDDNRIVYSGPIRNMYANYYLKLETQSASDVIEASFFQGESILLVSTFSNKSSSGTPHIVEISGQFTFAITLAFTYSLRIRCTNNALNVTNLTTSIVLHQI